MRGPLRWIGRSAVTSSIERYPWAFVVALVMISVWVSGPLLGFSETWQLVVNSYHDCHLSYGVRPAAPQFATGKPCMRS